MNYAEFTAVCGDQAWLAQAYQQKRITDDGLKELVFYLADTKGREVSYLLPNARNLLLEHVRLFLIADPTNIVNRLSVTKKIRIPGFILERDIYRHCADIEAYVRTKRERFRLMLVRLYGPQSNDLYQSAWRSDFARSFAGGNYAQCRTLLFMFGFRKLSYVGGMHYEALRQYEDRLLRCAREYKLDVETLKKNFAVEYQHVPRKVESSKIYEEQQAKAHLRMVGPK